MGSFSFSFLDEKTSEALLCLQKAVSLFLAAATSEVEESSCLLYAAGSSSIVFKDFKVPETEVQQCYDTSSRKTRWQIFRSTFFVLCNAGKPNIFRNLNPTVLQQTRCIRCSHTAVKMLSEVHEANLFQRAPTS